VNGTPSGKGPGKTIGGFEKKSMKDLKDDKKDKEDKDKSMSHLFYIEQGLMDSEPCSCALPILQAGSLYCW
jgi:hypothetical protein